MITGSRPGASTSTSGAFRQSAVAAAIVVVLAASCSPAPSVEPSAPTEPFHSPWPSATAAPSPSPAPTSTPSETSTFVVTELPRVELDDFSATAICDPSPDTLISDLPVEIKTALTNCPDAISMAVRALAAVGAPEIARLYVHLPFCYPDVVGVVRSPIGTCAPQRPEPVRPSGIDWPQVLCPATDPACLNRYANVVEVSARLTDGSTRLIAIVRRDETTVAVERSPSALWPTPTPGLPSPTVQTRSPGEHGPFTLPTCGAAVWGNPKEVLGCFRNAVIEGVPAGVIEETTGTEGGFVRTEYRFYGTGPIFATMTVTEGPAPSPRTTRSLGAMILGFDGATWSYHPLSLNPLSEILITD